LENLLRLLKICKINIVNSKCTQNLTENPKNLTQDYNIGNLLKKSWTLKERPKERALQDRISNNYLLILL